MSAPTTTQDSDGSISLSPRTIHGPHAQGDFHCPHCGYNVHHSAVEFFALITERPTIEMHLALHDERDRWRTRARLAMAIAGVLIAAEIARLAFGA